MEIGNGFLKLQDENSRRSSVFIQKPPDSKGGLPYTTRINCGCGDCIPFRVKVEKDEGSLRIGRLTLAANCHLILLVFGFCFLLAGTVLTVLAYKAQIPDLTNLHRHYDEDESSSRDQEKIAGPLFIIIGSGLVSLGVGLALLGYRLNRQAKRQRAAQSRFSLESPSNNRSPDYHAEFFSTFANLDELRSQGGDSNNRSRRSSFFGNSFNGRKSSLATISKAVPVGFFMSDSPRTPKTPNSPKDPNEFQEIELSSPTKQVPGIFGTHTSATDESLPPDYIKPALSLRPSLPIPMFGIPNSRVIAPLDPRSLVVTSRSDEPFGSIASLSGTGDIACFPVHWAPPVTVSVPEVDEEAPSQVTSVREKEFHKHNQQHESSELPPIKVNDFGNALTATQKNGLRNMREVKSEDRSTDPASPNRTNRRGSET